MFDLNKLSEMHAMLIEAVANQRQILARLSALEARIPAPLATVAQAAEHLQVSERTVRTMVSEQRLPVVRPTPGTVRIDLSKLQAANDNDAHEIAQQALSRF